MIKSLLVLLFSINLFGQALPYNDGSSAKSAKISWGTVENARSYDLEVYEDSNMKSVVEKKRLTVTSTILYLKKAGKFFYRVRGILPGGIEGPWSDLAFFEIKTVSMNFQLTFPQDRRTFENFVLGHSIVFKWRTSQSVSNYKIQILKGSKVVFENMSQKNKFKWAPQEMGSYRWRVGVATNIQEEWSNYYSFSVVEKKYSAKISLTWSPLIQEGYEGEVRSVDGVGTSFTNGNIYSTSLSLGFQTLAPGTRDVWKAGGRFYVDYWSQELAGNLANSIKARGFVQYVRYMPRLYFGPAMSVGYGQNSMIYYQRNSVVTSETAKIAKFNRPSFGVGGVLGLNLNSVLNIEILAQGRYDLGTGSDNLPSNIKSTIGYDGKFTVDWRALDWFDFSLGAAYRFETFKWTSEVGSFENTVKVVPFSVTAGVGIRF